MACLTDKNCDFLHGKNSHKMDEDEKDTISDKNESCEGMIFYKHSYLKSVMEMMHIMRNSRMLTDITLEVGHELLHAHKVVLAAASPYFKAMFTGGLKECEMSKVKLRGVCPKAMTKLLMFMYTGKLQVTKFSVCLLLSAATMFQITSVVEACCAFLEKQLDPTNAIGIADFAEQHCCTNLYHKANQFIIQHFNQICQGEEFLQLSAAQLVPLVDKDELNVQDEREVYNAVLKWVEYNEEARGPTMQHILQAVRCHFLTPNFLRDQMKNCDLLKKVPVCKEYLGQIFKDLTLHKKPIVKERTPNIPRIIYIAGGLFNSCSLDLLESYNIDDKKWSQHERLLLSRSGLGGAFLKGKLYVVGGRNNTPEIRFDSDWVDCYDPVIDHWRTCSPLSVPRNRPGVTVMDGLLYAVGGSASRDYHNTVECYDADHDSWTSIKPMHKKRLGAGVTVVNRLLYVIGGFDGEERFKSVECYHPENNEWSFVSPMQDCRTGAGVASIGQHVYAVGGFTGENHLNTVERYDTERDKWEYVSPLKIGRSALGVIVLDGKLYAMGGFDGKDYVGIVEIYDPATNEWEEGVPMTFGRAGHVSVVSYQHCPVHCENT